ncbi:branched-chain amino acid ABC transporter permease [Oceanibacterium hippocampi]|uniref:High-affinity branched-chain amino acid transport system permease protein LivH n=1 Tax=Oceanibacterium hippocampi TaxID=745714 RepID=A0A1Y5TSY4_9PROT|nr:branched-chain amino acid ABC transporter permease [Oceanibacterium hippocampi]SLN70719.1 High-affinity branched-chain amino acid transport system permease protein LivH [Oceanibacterium hippocampi]
MTEIQFLVQQLTNGLILGSTYSLVAIGLTMVFGVLGVINLAQGEIFMVGAFGGLLALQAGFGLPGALLAGIIAAGLCGYLIERFALRPLPSGVDPHIPMVSTIGAGILLQEIAAGYFSAREQPYITPDFLATTFDIGPIKLDALNIFIISLTLILTVGLSLFLSKARLGLAIRAVAENPGIAQLMGVNRVAVVALVFVLSSVLAGIAGVLVGMYFHNISPFVGIGISLKGLAAVILGGLGSVNGAVVAGFVIGVSEVMAVSYFDASWRDAVAFGVMILVLLLRPSGLFGRAVAEKV